MAALAGGLAAVVLGIIGIIVWWSQFIQLVAGALPAMFILGGALAAYLGFEEIKDKKAAERLDDKSDELKKEVDSLKQEIKGLKEQKETKEESE